MVAVGLIFGWRANISELVEWTDLVGHWVCCAVLSVPEERAGFRPELETPVTANPTLGAKGENEVNTTAKKKRSLVCM